MLLLTSEELLLYVEFPIEASTPFGKGAARRAGVGQVRRATFQHPARSLSDIAFVTRRKRCGQTQDRRPGKTESYSLEYVEDFQGRE